MDPELLNWTAALGNISTALGDGPEVMNSTYHNIIPAMFDKAFAIMVPIILLIAVVILFRLFRR